MKKHGLYRRMAVNSIRKNGRMYAPYLLTCICMIMVSYLFFFLIESEQVREMRGGDLLQEMLVLGSGVFGIFSLIFLFYTNSFLIRRRKQEFGLYNILGMGKWNIARILIWESVLTALLSFGGGLLLGVLFSKASELAIAHVLGGEISLRFSVAPGAMWTTLVIFAVIFVLILANGLRQIQMANPMELLHSDRTGEKPPKGNVLLALVGLLLLAAAYYIAVSLEDPTSALIGFFGAVLLVILATYLLFIAGSVVFCRLLKKRKSYYYKANHFVSVSSMLYRMKRNGAGLASICVLSTMVLVMVSAVISLYVGKENALRETYPRDIQIQTLSVKEEYETAVYDTVEGELAKSGLSMRDPWHYRYLAVTGCVEGDQAWLRAKENSQNIVGDYASLRTLFFVPVEDYNKLAGKEETLEKDEVLVSCNRGTAYGFETMTLHDVGTWKVKGEVPEFVSNSLAASQIVSSVFIILPDMETFFRVDEAQRQVYGEHASIARTYLGFEVDGLDDGEEDEAMIALSERIDAAIDALQFGGTDDTFRGVTSSCIANERAFFYGMYGGLFVLGILLGCVFIVAAVLIMYYKQITEGYEDQSRFEVMRKVGMTKQDIRRSVNSQMLTVFFLPLALAGLHQLFAFPPVYKILMLFGLSNESFVRGVTTVCFLIFAVFYTAVYLITSRAYYRIVSKSFT